MDRVLWSQMQVSLTWIPEAFSPSLVGLCEHLSMGTIDWTNLALASSCMGDRWYIFATPFNGLDGAQLMPAFNLDITCGRQVVTRRLTKYHTLPPEDVIQSPRQAVIAYRRGLRRVIMQEPFLARPNGMMLL